MVAMQYDERIERRVTRRILVTPVFGGSSRPPVAIFLPEKNLTLPDVPRGPASHLKLPADPCGGENHRRDGRPYSQEHQHGLDQKQR
jgi:hypothetical protein